jgi:hypothetical protein
MILNTYSSWLLSIEIASAYSLTAIPCDTVPIFWKYVSPPATLAPVAPSNVSLKSDVLLYLS